MAINRSDAHQEGFDDRQNVVLERFARGSMDRDEIMLRLEMFKAYFEEPFIDGEERDKFWKAMEEGRFEEAMSHMLPVHAGFLLDLIRQMPNDWRD